MQFQTEELEYMMMGFISENENRMEAQTRGWGLGIGTNYGETKSINRREQVVRVAGVIRGLVVVSDPHMAC